jgi:hypothetical protein
MHVCVAFAFSLTLLLLLLSYFALVAALQLSTAPFLLALGDGSLQQAAAAAAVPLLAMKPVPPAPIRSSSHHAPSLKQSQRHAAALPAQTAPSLPHSSSSSSSSQALGM